MNIEAKLMNGAEALQCLLDGKAVTRVAYGVNGRKLYIKAQFPDEHSKMNSPYLYMYKDGDTFPYVYSNETLFGNDFYTVNEEDYK